jgi:multidrug resistance efflux pump
MSLGTKNRESMLADQARELYRLHTELDLATHKAITCGVAAEHPEIASQGVYIEKWDSPQAQQVRKVVAERDALRARVAELEVQLAAMDREADEDEARIAELEAERDHYKGGLDMVVISAPENAHLVASTYLKPRP